MSTTRPQGHDDPGAPRSLAAAVHTAARAFGIDPAHLEFVRGVANAVYAAGTGASTRFLRLTHNSDHTAAHVAAELEWLRFLRDEGLPVVQPLPAADGSWVVLPGSEWTAALFARVRGEPISLTDFGAPEFELMGRFLGGLHRVSAGFTPAEPGRVRPQWHEWEPFDGVLASWPEDDGVVAAAWRAVHARVSRVAATPQGFGLIHADLHRGNVFRHAGGIDVFDFDDSCYFHLAADVANAVYYALWPMRYDPEPEREHYAQRFLDALLRGYALEHSPEHLRLSLVPDLIEYRDLTVDAFSHRRFADRPDGETQRRWQHVRARLAAGAPYVGLRS